MEIFNASTLDEMRKDNDEKAVKFLRDAFDPFFQLFYFLGSVVALLVLLSQSAFFTDSPNVVQQTNLAASYQEWCTEWINDCDRCLEHPIQDMVMCVLDSSTSSTNLLPGSAAYPLYQETTAINDELYYNTGGKANMYLTKYMETYDSVVDGNWFLDLIFTCNTTTYTTPVRSLDNGTCWFEDANIVDLFAFKPYANSTNVTAGICNLADIATCYNRVQFVEQVAVARVYYFQICAFPTYATFYAMTSYFVLAFVCLSYFALFFSKDAKGVASYRILLFALTCNTLGMLCISIIGLAGFIEDASYDCFRSDNEIQAASMFGFSIVLFLSGILYIGVVITVAISQRKFLASLSGFSKKKAEGAKDAEKQAGQGDAVPPSPTALNADEIVIELAKMGQEAVAELVEATQGKDEKDEKH